MLGEGAVLLIYPNLLLKIAGIPATGEVWIRLAGIALCVLGDYYIRSARANLTEFFGGAGHMRLLQFFIILVLVILKLGPPVILAFAAVEFASGIWTRILIRGRVMGRAINQKTPWL